MIITVTRFHPEYEAIAYTCKFSEKQLQYIDAIERYKMYTKKVPTIRDIAKIMEVKSPATVEYMLERLSNKGYNYKEV